MFRAMTDRPTSHRHPRRGADRADGARAARARVAERRGRAVAARDAQRARAFAAKHGIPRVHASYEELIADPELDAIYNPLPNSHHCEWTVRALEAGKHVLCEKPLASNAAEAADDGRRRAAHRPRAHRGVPLALPPARRAHARGDRERRDRRRRCTSRRRSACRSCCPATSASGSTSRAAPRWTPAATRSTWCARSPASEPEVTSAQVQLSSPGVDRWMAAELRFPAGCTGRVECSLASAKLIAASARVVGDRGELRVTEPDRAALLPPARRRSRRRAGAPSA